MLYLTVVSHCPIYHPNPRSILFRNFSNTSYNCPHIRCDDLGISLTNDERSIISIRIIWVMVVAGWSCFVAILCSESEKWSGYFIRDTRYLLKIFRIHQIISLIACHLTSVIFPYKWSLPRLFPTTYLVGRFDGQIIPEIPLDSMMIEMDSLLLMPRNVPKDIWGEKILQMRVICTVQEVAESTTGVVKEFIWF